VAFSFAGLDYRDYVTTDPALHRPAEVNLLLGDCTKAKATLGWDYRIPFEDLVREMVEADCRAHGVPLPISGTGYAIT
jgi:GDPmannose 4,6-dehydratase